MPRALSRLRTAVTPAAATPEDWRSDEAITLYALRAGAREHELDAVLAQVRGPAPLPLPKAAQDKVRNAVQNVRAGGAVKYGTGIFGWGRYSPKPGNPDKP